MSSSSTSSSAALSQQFDLYKANNSLVLNVAPQSRGAIGPSSEVQSLTKNYTAHELQRLMGSRAAFEIEKKKQKKSSHKKRKLADGREVDDDEEEANKAKKDSISYSSLLASSSSSSSSSSSALSLSLAMPSLYQPQTKETQLVYDTLLSSLASLIPQAAHDVLLSAADELLVILKDETRTAVEQQQEVESLFAVRLSTDRFRQFLNIAKKITDFQAVTSAKEQEVESSRRGEGEGDDSFMARSRRKEDVQSSMLDDAIDDRVGISVQFNEDEEEDEEDDAHGMQDFVDDKIEEDDELEAGDGFVEEEKKDDFADERKEDTALRSKGSRLDDAIDDDDPSLEGDVVLDRRRNRKAASSSTASSTTTPSASSFDARAVDAHWLQRQVSLFETDASTSLTLASNAFELMSNLRLSNGAIEMQLIELFGVQQFALIRLCVSHRWLIVYGMKLARAATSATQRQAIEQEMLEHEELEKAHHILFRSDSSETSVKQEEKNNSSEKSSSAESTAFQRTDAFWLQRARHQLDLESLTLAGGAHFMSNTETTLPKGSEMFTKKSCIEVHVPAAIPSSSSIDHEKIVKIEEMPPWARPAFRGMTSLNRVQSRVYEMAMNSADNMLVCAPTGAGKTNVAMLAMLQQIGLYRKLDAASASSMMDDNDTSVTVPLDLDAFKLVYIAPMKSLVAEMVLNFRARLACYGMQVQELSGDTMLSSEQLSRTQLIVTTPEKWDVVTRKAVERSYLNAVKLVIVDEVHLLHDARGPVLEAILARMLRRVEEEQVYCRVVGLSATLPNHEDVALFLRVDPQRGLFSFDASYRPVPLHTQYVGITVKKAFKRMQIMNEICYEKVMVHAGKKQMIVFVHSRKDTAVTARFFKDKATENDALLAFLSDANTGRQEILRVESEAAQSEHLKLLLPYGLAIHHAGLTRQDRTLVEELFAAGHISVLVSTATLAWGVNLPASVVIIKGTAVYNAELSQWTELSPLDVMQMFGRAGRPQYDVSGEGILITAHANLQFYLSLLNQQLPIESQLITALPDVLNAECVLTNVTSLQEGVDWLSNSYLFVRMLRKPSVYGVTTSSDSDPYLEQRRLDLIHSAALLLDKHGLLRYDRRTGALQSLDAGRIASYYYLSYKSLAAFEPHLSAQMSDIDCFRVFSLSNEFASMSVREEEKLELASLMDKVPVPIKEGIEEASAKVNVLLQAYISRLNLDGYALLADMVYVTQSAGRIVRALFELTLRRGWSAVALRFLTLANEIEHRCWSAQSPLRQFAHLSLEGIKKIEGKDLTWTALCDLEAAALGDLIRHPKLGTQLYKAIHAVPSVELSGHVQPLTRSLLRIELSLTPDFQWQEKLHGSSQAFWLFVEDQDSNSILASEMLVIRKSRATQTHTTVMHVPLFDPLAPNYFLRCVNDRFLASERLLPLSFKRLILPSHFQPPTELLDMMSASVEALSSRDHDELEHAYQRYWRSKGVHTLNAVHTQVLASLYRAAAAPVSSSNDVTHINAFVAAPSGSRKSLLAEMALFANRSLHPRGKCVWMTPLASFARNLRARLQETLAPALGWKIGLLTGEPLADAAILASCDVIVTTPQDWDGPSRRWKMKSSIIHSSLTLFLLDHCQLLGHTLIGPMMEVVASRMRFIQTQLNSSFRIVALSRPVANAHDLAQWLGCPSAHSYCFAPYARPSSLEMRLVGIEALDFNTRQNALIKPAYRAIEAFLRVPQQQQQRIITFSSDVKQVKFTALAWLALTISRGALSVVHPELAAAGARSPEALRAVLEEREARFRAQGVKNESLLTLMTHGMAWMHQGQPLSESDTVACAYHSGEVTVLLLDHESSWTQHSLLDAELVMLLDTQAYQASAHAHAEVSASTIAQMASFARSRVLIYLQSGHKEDMKRFLASSASVESHLPYVLHSTLIGEVINKRIVRVQDAIDYLTWSFLYRRLPLNPNYYNLTGASTSHLSDYLSELVESTLQELDEARMLSVENLDQGGGGTINALNLGLIAAYYQIDHLTIEIFNRSLTKKSKIKQIIDALCAAAEFDRVSVKEREENVLSSIARNARYAVSVAAGDGVGGDESRVVDFTDAHAKVNVLLQSYLSRRTLPATMLAELRDLVLPLLPKLCSAVVDVLSSNAHLLPALIVMEFSQQIIQGQWSSESPLYQLPHFDAALVQRCNAAGVLSVTDVLDLDDDVRVKLLALPMEQLQEVAEVANAYPDLALDYTVTITTPDADGEDQTHNFNKGETVAAREGDRLSVLATITAPQEDGVDFVPPTIQTRFFPQKRSENWWLVLGDMRRNELLAIKRITLTKAIASARLETTVPAVDASQGQGSEMQLFLISDCWIGSEKEVVIRFAHQARLESKEEEVEMKQ